MNHDHLMSRKIKQNTAFQRAGQRTFPRMPKKNQRLNGDHMMNTTLITETFTRPDELKALTNYINTHYKK